MKNADLTDEFEKRLRGALAAVPFLQVEKIDRLEGDVTLSVLLRLPLGQKRLLVFADGFGEPRVAREAAARLNQEKLKDPDAYGVFAALYVSQLTAEILEKEKCGYFDMAGNCFLSFGMVHIRIGGFENPAVQRKRVRALYSPRAERVLRVLLARPARYRAWKVKELAEAARVSLGQVSNVRTMLLDREWVKEGKDGIALTRPADLLEEWALNYRFDRNGSRDFYTMKSVAEAEVEIADTCARKGIRYAFTAFSGIARTAPNVYYPKATVFVVERLDELAEAAGLKEVPSGANVSLIVPYDPEGVLYTPNPEAGDPRVVSWAQCYLDARSMKGRGEEAADFFLDNYMRPLW